MGTPGLFAGLLSVPLTTYAGWVAALLAVRVRRSWLVALVAAPMTLVAAIGTYAVAGASNGPSSGSAAIAAALLIGGPVAGLIAGVTVLGAGWPRVAAIPVTILLLVMTGVILVKVVTPLRQAGTVTKYVPHPYRYDDPTLTLQSLNLNSYTQSLELEYVATGQGGGVLSLTEYRAPADAQAAASQRCTPPVLGPPICVRVPAAGRAIGLWRSGPEALNQVVVLTGDALLVVTVSDVPTDQVAHDVAARLKPEAAATLISSAQSTSIYDFGTGTP